MAQGQGNPQPSRSPATQFAEGNPGGNINPAKRATGRAAWRAMLADFEVHGVHAIERMREEFPSQYVQLAASGLPTEKSIDLNVHRRETLSEEQSRMMAETIIEQHKRRIATSPVESASVYDSAATRLPTG